MAPTDRSNLEGLDYRSFPFYRILTKGRGSVEVGGWKFIFVLAALAAMAIGSLASAVFSKEGDDILENLKLAFLESMVFLVALNEYSCQESYTKLVEFIGKCRRTLRYDLPGEELIVSKAYDSAKGEVKFYMLVFFMNYPSMLLARSVTDGLSGKSWKKLPVPWVLPSQDSIFQFTAVLVLQVVAIGFSHCLGVTGMCFSTITTQITALYDVLLLGLERIDERAVLTMKSRQLGYEESMSLCLRESMAHLRELLKEINSETSHLETSFFSLTLHISMIMALEAYPLIKEGCTVGAAIKGVVFLSIQIMCTYIVCNRMEMMSDKTTQLFYTLYNTPWFNCDTSYRRVLLNGLTLTRKPTLIKGKYFQGLTATRATFYTSITNSFNILNMMRRMM
ncbi:Hypothetical protein NTJ_12428 [Nesidiocoris tenuis]|uniref:Odorant receptor n=1 Tax=Nesidiocoris tenuis TaxID=355587 RepID=A0ABN7B5C3_9HEMI|nr:Hypothetical protein NTJ_12428 [Nesidiocoris tenuis]